MSDWIKMRGSLMTNPKVIRMSRLLAADRFFMDWWTRGTNKQCDETVYEICDVTVVTRVTIGSLLSVWSSVNECASIDGFVKGITLFEVDEMAGVPGFGDAMFAVGWVEEVNGGLVFPNFHEHNTVGKERSSGAKTGSQRTKEWRERKAKESAEPVTSDVTVTSRSDHREEKRREEKKEPKSKAEASASRLPADWMPTEGEISFCQTERPDLNPVSVASQFRDYWIAQPGAKGRKLDWPATWRNWVRNQRGTSGPRQIHSYHDERAETIAALTGRNRYEHESEATDQRQLRIAVAG